MRVGAEVGAAPDIAAIRDARRTLVGTVRHTPLERSPWLSELAGVDVHLKLECWQRTRSFKIRGAMNAVSSLDEAARRRGLVAASAGNHGLAVALAARLRGARATIFVPGGAPATKKDRIRREGAQLRTVAGGYDAAAAAARRFAAETGATPVHAFADPLVVAGQGTVGLEIVEDRPDVRHVVVPVGGGGLAAGVGAAVRAMSPAEVLGVQSGATRAMHEAFAAGRVVPVAEEPTLCDGLAGETEPAPYEWARRVVASITLVPEEEIAGGIRSLYAHEGVVAEGAGVVGAVAVATGALELDGPTVVVISGGNIDPGPLARILGAG